jgi:hypothetical protein
VYELVVSTENNAYMAWQALLLHASCVRRGLPAPTVVVHGDGPLVPGLDHLGRCGGRLQRAPSYRGGDYAPRNTAGTLERVETDAPFVVILDADLIFLDRPSWPQPERDEVVSNLTAYLQPDDGNREPLAAACRVLGLQADILAHGLHGGTPYLVRTEIARDFAQEWLRCIDVLRSGPGSDGFRYLASMWGFVLAAVRLGLRESLVDICTWNLEGVYPLTVTQAPASLLHYCYGDSWFQKHQYAGDEAVAASVWSLSSIEGDSAAAAIRAEISAARDYYRIFG